MDTQTLIPRLVSDFGYPPAGAELVAEKIAKCSPSIADAFAAWWASGTLPKIEVEGYTIQRLMDEHRMNVIAAFLTLDWLTREPYTALASLKKGHDRVGSE